MALPVVGELELAVLEHLWRVGEDEVAGAHAALGDRGITPNTVGSAMERLHRKGLLRRRKVSHAYWYEPAMDRAAYRARRALDASGGLRGLAQGGVLAAFVDLLGEHDERTLDRLQALIAERRRGKERR
jgi:predicted transcriptional regulator